MGQQYDVGEWEDEDLLVGVTNVELTGIKAVWLANGERIGAGSVATFWRAALGPDGEDDHESRDLYVQIRRTNGNTLTVRHGYVIGVER